MKMESEPGLVESSLVDSPQIRSNTTLTYSNIRCNLQNKSDWVDFPFSN